jgi:hypothetical protein
MEQIYLTTIKTIVWSGLCKSNDISGTEICLNFWNCDLKKN